MPGRWAAHAAAAPTVVSLLPTRNGHHDHEDEDEQCLEDEFSEDEAEDECDDEIEDRGYSGLGLLGRGCGLAHH